MFEGRRLRDNRSLSRGDAAGTWRKLKADWRRGAIGERERKRKNNSKINGAYGADAWGPVVGHQLARRGAAATAPS